MAPHKHSVAVLRLRVVDLKLSVMLLPTQGGPLAFPRLKTGDSIEAWCKEVVQDCGVLLLPASVYDHQGSTDRGHFRFSLGRKDMPECLKALDAWCVSKYGDPDAAAQ